MRNEYIVDRLNTEIKGLREEIDDLREEYAVREVNVIVAEIVLFLFGMLIGAILMKQMGGV